MIRKPLDTATRDNKGYLGAIFVGALRCVTFILIILFLENFYN